MHYFYLSMSTISFLVQARHVISYLGRIIHGISPSLLPSGYTIFRTSYQTRVAITRPVITNMKKYTSLVIMKAKIKADIVICFISKLRMFIETFHDIKKIHFFNGKTSLRYHLYIKTTFLPVFLCFLLYFNLIIIVALF